MSSDSLLELKNAICALRNSSKRITLLNKITSPDYRSQVVASWDSVSMTCSAALSKLLHVEANKVVRVKRNDETQFENQHLENFDQLVRMAIVINYYYLPPVPVQQLLKFQIYVDDPLGKLVNKIANEAWTALANDNVSAYIQWLNLTNDKTNVLKARRLLKQSTSMLLETCDSLLRVLSRKNSLKLFNLEQMQQGFWPTRKSLLKGAIRNPFKLFQKYWNEMSPEGFRSLQDTLAHRNKMEAWDAADWANIENKIMDIMDEVQQEVMTDKELEEKQKKIALLDAQLLRQKKQNQTKDQQIVGLQKELQKKVFSLEDAQKVLAQHLVQDANGWSVKKTWDKQYSNALVILIIVAEYDAQGQAFGNKNLKGCTWNRNECTELFSERYGWDMIRNKVPIVKKNDVDTMLQRAEIKFQSGEYDSVIVLWTGHGKESYVTLSDGKPYPRKRLYSFFNGKKCPNKTKCPKLFVIGTCNTTAQNPGPNLQIPLQANQLPDGVHPDEMRVIMNPNTVGGMSFTHHTKGEILVGSFCNGMGSNLGWPQLNMIEILNETDRELKWRKNVLKTENNWPEDQRTLNNNHQVTLCMEITWPLVNMLKATFVKRNNPGQRDWRNVGSTVFQYYSDSIL